MLNANGYKRKTYDDLLTDMSNRTKQLFGENTNLSERSVIGILIRIMAWFLSLAYQDQENVYYSAYRTTAKGSQLDKLLPYSGITRNLATYAFGELAVIGAPNHTVPAGFLASTESDELFETTEDVTLDIDGDGVVPIRAISIGQRGLVGANTIIEIVNPDANVFFVTNNSPTTGGRDKETDTEVRERADTAIEGQGSGTAPSIRTNILRVPSVRAAVVIDNSTDDTDIYGTPSRALQAFVLGGEEEDIAYAIFQKKSAGIQPFGEIYTTVVDDSGQSHLVGFTRAVEIQIYLNVIAEVNNAFPLDGAEQIKSTLVRFIGGVDSNSVIYAGLNMGEDVINSKLVSRIYSVPGIDDVQIELSTDGITYSPSNVTVGLQEVAQANAAQIEVTINV